MDLLRTVRGHELQVGTRAGGADVDVQRVSTVVTNLQRRTLTRLPIHTLAEVKQLRVELD